jgi:hypothetical protein
MARHDAAIGKGFVWSPGPTAHIAAGNPHPNGANRQPFDFTDANCETFDFTALLPA